MMRLLGATSAIVALFASNVLAADAIVYSEPAPIAQEKAFDWSGAYIGAHIGYGWGSIHDVDNPNASKHDTDGFLGGVQAGYNWQLANRFVVGIEADVSFANINAEWTDVAYYGEDKHEITGSLRGRLGYAFDRFLPYLHGGLAWAKNDHMLGCSLRNVHGSTCRDTSFETSEDDFVTGYTIGAGAEYAIDRHWSVKADYAFTDYGKNKLRVVDPNYLASPLNTRNFESKNHTIKLGVNYRF